MLNRYTKQYNKLPLQVKASVWFLVCSFVQRGISMLTTPIFTRLLSSSEYGQYNIFNSWMSIFAIFVSLNLSAGVYSQGLVKFDKNRDLFSSSLQGLSTALIIIWALVYLLFHDFLNSITGLKGSYMIMMILLIWCNSIFGFWASEQRVLYRYKILVLITLLVSVFGPFLSIVLIHYLEDKVLSRILGMLLVELCFYIFLYIDQIKRGKYIFSEIFWVYALRYNLPLIPHYLSQTVLSSADRIMIARMDTESHSGIYSLAYSISMIMTIMNTSLMQTLSPWMFQKIKEKKHQEIAPVAYASLFLIALINIILILLAPEIIILFAPIEYYEAIWIIPPVAISVYFMYCYDLFSKFAFYYEKTQSIMIASVTGAALNIILNYVFIRRFGYISAGYTTLICYIVYCCAHYHIMNKVCDKNGKEQRPYNPKILLWISATFTLLGLCMVVTYRFPIIRYSLLMLILTALYLGKDGFIRFYKDINRRKLQE